MQLIYGIKRDASMKTNLPFPRIKVKTVDPRLSSLVGYLAGPKVGVPCGVAGIASFSQGLSSALICSEFMST